MITTRFVAAAVALLGISASVYQLIPNRSACLSPLSRMESREVHGGASYCYVSGNTNCNSAYVGCSDAGGTGNTGYCPYQNGVATCTYKTGWEQQMQNYPYAKLSTTQGGSASTANQPPVSCYTVDDCAYGQPCAQDPMRNFAWYCQDNGPANPPNSPPVTPRVPAGAGCGVGS